MTKNEYYVGQLIGLIIVGLALQGLLSLIGYWGFYSLVFPFMWLIRIFLIYELAVGLHHYAGGRHKPLPWIGKYAEKAFS